MKLETKFQDEDFELGEVVDGVIVECLGRHEEELRVIATAAKGGQHTFYYSSIKKFMDDWKDAPEEPKKYWYIDAFGNIVQNEITKHCGDEYTDMSNEYENQKEIGNYFETKEEAEKAVEKLKAWKRLKDGGITFKNWSVNQTGTIDCFATWGNNIPTSREDPTLLDDLDLIFGGEE